MTSREVLELRRYQQQGVDFLLHGSSRLLADEMGLGKTVQVAAALAALRSAGELRKALIVCPASLQLNWERELRRFGPRCAVRSTVGASELDRHWLYRMPVPVVIVSYESVRSDFLPNSPISELDVVVFDEAQRLKNDDSTTAWAARRVPSKRRWLLSATPLENGVADLGSLAKVMRIVGHGEDLENSDVIREAFQGNFLRRKKSDVLPELPPIITQNILLHLVGSQLEEYEDVRSESELNGSVADLLAAITRLKLVCNRGSDGTSIKLDALRLLLDDPAVEPAKVIVISQYASTLTWLAEQLNIATFTYSGDFSAQERDDALQGFRKADIPAVLLLSLKAGGVGLNIVEATHVVLFDRWWTPAAEAQAIARAHRFGREAPLLVFSFRVVDSVEDRIVEVAQGKADLFDDLVEGRLVGDADVAGWSRSELLQVLQNP